MFKKLLIIVVILITASVILVSTNITTKSLYEISNGASVNMVLGSGDINIIAGDQKNIIKTELTHNIIKKPAVSLSGNILAITADKLPNGQIALPQNAILSELSAKAGAGNFDIQLKNLMVQKISIEGGAINLTLELPQDVSSTAHVAIGAGNVDIKIPANGKLEGVKIIGQGISNSTFSSEAWDKINGGVQTKKFSEAKTTSVIDLTNSGAINLSTSGEE